MITFEGVIKLFETGKMNFDKLPPGWEDEIDRFISHSEGKVKEFSELVRKYLLSKDYAEKEQFGNNAEEILSLIQEERGKNIDSVYSKETLELANERFQRPDLLHQIFKELDKGHVGDNHAKMLIFLCGSTALMLPEYRISVRVCGDSTAGKDNLINVMLKHMPPKAFETYTGTSDKFLLRLVDSSPGIYVGELNLQRRGGANQNIVEVLKASAEGGTSYGYLEPDKQGKQVTKKTKNERKVIIYSGTEIGQDDELSNRVLSIAVEGSEKQTREVLNRLAEDNEEKDKESWISAGLYQLDKVKVEIPTDIRKVLVKMADASNVRARRDIKLSLIHISEPTRPY